MNFLSLGTKDIDLSEIVLELQDLYENFKQEVWSFVGVEIHEFPFDFPIHCHFSRNSSYDQCDIDAHLLNVPLPLYLVILDLLVFYHHLKRKSQSKNHNHLLVLDYLMLMDLVPVHYPIQTMTLQIHMLRTLMSSAALHYSPPQDEHHHEDLPDLLGERKEFYMLFVVPEVFQNTSREPTIVLCLVAAIEDHIS
nr:hypothetical protein [Tanacetum cinerariifolium]